MPNAPDSIIQKKRVLLLEDDEKLTTMIKKFLESNFYEVVAVTNGADGIRTLQNEPEFAIIICDMVMPKLPGDMFYFAVKKKKPHLCRRFIFITGYKSDSKINDFIKEVEGAMLNKPFHMDKLLEVVSFVQSLPCPSTEISNKLR